MFALRKIMQLSFMDIGLAEGTEELSTWLAKQKLCTSSLVPTIACTIDKLLTMNGDLR